MAVVFEGKREVTVNGGTSIQIQIPAEAAEGDLLIAYIAKDDNVAIYTNGDYSSWNMLYNIIDDSQTCLYLAWRIATTDDVSGAVSWTWNADSEDWVGEILCYRGADTTTPIPFKGSAHLDSSDTPTAPSVEFSNLEAGSLVFQCFGCDFDDTPRIMASGLTERFNQHQANDIGGAGGDKVNGFWVSPTGYNDPDSKWIDEEEAYDNDIQNNTYHTAIPATSWGSYLELTINAISCSKIRAYLSDYYGVLEVSIDVYYSSAWHNIYEGAFADKEWVEYAIGSTETVTAMRLKFENTDSVERACSINEVDFYNTGAIEGTGETGTAVFGIPASNEWTAATLVIKAASAAGIFYQSVAGVFSATGAVVKLPKISLSGVLSSTGSLVKKTLLNLSGSFGLTGIVSSIFKFPKSLAGAFGLTGMVSKLPKISLAGVFSSTGTITKLPKIILSGVLSSTGVVSPIWKSFQSLAGTFGLTGTITKLPKISLSGAFDFAGETSRKILLTLSGVFGATGTVASVLKKFKSLSGVFDFVGSGVGELLGGIFYKSLEGAFALTGGVSTILTKFKSLAGTFDFSGSLNRLTKIALAGVLSATGIVTSVFTRFVSLAGSFDFTGNVGKLIKKGLSGVFTLTGTVNKLIKVILSGTFGLTGVATTIKKVFKSLVGAFGLTGVVNKLIKLSLSGAFDFTGTVGKLIKKALSGVFDFTGDLASQLIGIFYKSLSGVFGFSGNLNKKIMIALVGAFGLTGTINSIKKIFKAIAGAFDFSGSGSGVQRFIKALTGTFDFSGSISNILTIFKTLSGSLTFTGYLFFRTFWNKVIKETADWAKVVKEQSWFVMGWFTEWFGRIWGNVNKTTDNYTKVSKDDGNWTKVNKEKDNWEKIEKE